MDDHLKCYDEYANTDIEAANDTFMLFEGLELLADYRAIKDAQLRAKLRNLIAVIRNTQTETEIKV